MQGRYRPLGASSTGDGAAFARGFRLPAGILVILALVLAPLGPARPASDAAPVVTVTQARPAEIVIEVPVTGSLVAREEVMVNPRIGGRIITALHADVGDRVARGDLLAELDRELLEVQLAQAEAEKARAEAAVKQARSQIQQAQATRDNARITLERNRKLRENGTISQAVLDRSETAYRSAEAALRAAENGLAVAQAQLRLAEARLRMARINLGYTRITAPVAGTIARRNARLGAVAMAGPQPMFSIIARNEIVAEVEVLETDINTIHPGDPVRLEIAGVGVVEGRVRLIPPTVDRRTRLARVRISLPPRPGLKTGAFARGRIRAARFTALTVPVSAVLSEGGEDYVLVVGTDDVLERRSVRLGAVWRGRRQIIAGLKEGERVLLRAGPFFQEGDRVRPVLEAAMPHPGKSGTAEGQP